MILVVVSVGGTVCENMTSAVTSAPVFNDSCSNHCEGSDSYPFYWCGENREDGAGEVVRCVEYTVKGGYCMSGCDKKGKSYYWCMTNALELRHAP